MKIAIPVENDKTTVAKKTGQAAFFAIYENGVSVDFVVNGRGGEHNHSHGDNHHDHEHMEDEEHTSSHKKDISGIEDCDLILVRAVGEHIRDALVSLNIDIKKVREKDGHTADETLKSFLEKNI